MVVGHSGIAVHDDCYCGFFGKADGGLHGFGEFRGVAVPLLYFFAFAGGALFRLPSGLVFYCLLFESVSLSYCSSVVKWISFISLISVITIACVPVRSNTVPLARTYLPTNGVSSCR